MAPKNKISNIERQINASKYRIKDLQNAASRQRNNPKSKDKRDFETLIQQEKSCLELKRQELAALYVKQYNLSL